MTSQTTEQSLQSLIESWQGLGVMSRYDAETGSWIFICLHDDTLGPMTGGTRMKTYPALEDALLDAMRLAEGMTHKWAGLDIGFGGAKAVIAVPHPMAGDEREGLLRRYGRLVESLRGTFLTGEDLGTTTSDMEILSQVTGHVHGFDAQRRKVDPSPYTARGVLSGLRAGLRHLYGSADPAGRSVLIEGFGNVGRHLARMLAEQGARLLVSDIDPARSQEGVKDYGAELVSPDQVYETACDIYAPCAIGATLDRQSIPLLACRLVVGSANNQLAEPIDAERLHQRGILYLPDFVVNAGGALSFGLIAQGELPGDALLAKMDRIGSMVTEILREADARGESPLAAARRRMESALERARQGRAEEAQPVS